MKIKYYARITYTINKNHPDIQYLANWTEGAIYAFSDVYEFDTNYGYTKDYIMDYIKQDLRLVAGGGYNSKYIENVTFNIKQI